MTKTTLFLYNYFDNGKYAIKCIDYFKTNLNELS